MEKLNRGRESRSRSRSRARYLHTHSPKLPVDRTISPVRSSNGEFGVRRSRSRSRSLSPQRQATRQPVSSSSALWSDTDTSDDSLREEYRRCRVPDPPRYWRQRGRSPITLRELNSLITDYDRSLGTRILVAGLNSIVTEEDLRRIFADFGRIHQISIIKENKTGDSRGMALLTLDSSGNADAAVRSLDQMKWYGRVIVVEKLP